MILKFLRFKINHYQKNYVYQNYFKYIWLFKHYVIVMHQTEATDAQDVSFVVPALPSLTILGYHPPRLSLVTQYQYVPLIWVTHEDYGFGVWEGFTVQIFKYYQFIHHLSFPASNCPQVTPLAGHFPVYSENLLLGFQNGIPPLE